MNIGIIVNTNVKGQVVIPKKIRDSLAISPQTPLQIIQAGQSIVLHPISDVVRRTDSRETWRDILEMTAGSWGPATGKENKSDKKRERTELLAARKRRIAW